MLEIVDYLILPMLISRFSDNSSLFTVLNIPDKGKFFYFSSSLHDNIAGIDVNVLELIFGDINYLVCFSISLMSYTDFSLFFFFRR